AFEVGSRVESGRVALPFGDLCRDRRLRRSRLGALASAGELLEIRHDAVLQDAGAGNREKGGVLRGLGRPWSDPPGCAGSEEPDAVRVDLRRSADRGNRADRVRRHEVEVTVNVRATLPLRLSNTALVVGEERYPIPDIRGDERAVRESRLLAASV